MIPVIFRWEPFKRSAFFVEAIKSFVINTRLPADAYTTNSQLPEHVALTEKIELKDFALGLGGAFVVYTNKKNNQFTVNVSSGICDENFIVDYTKYDEANYEVLNPDVAANYSGLYAAVAALYNFHKRKQDMFIMLRLQTASSAAKHDHYTLSYNKTSPLQLTFGYKLFYAKNKKK
ncbi:MAG: hypothetical protein KGM16_03315 [Bacteroidota bacterium]|nr:hypothetical protein [Bacteroidota bacterium]